MEILNVIGQRIRILVEEIVEPGCYSVQWDGRDDAGQIVTTGMYIVRVRTRKNGYVGKLLMIR